MDIFICGDRGAAALIVSLRDPAFHPTSHQELRAQSTAKEVVLFVHAYANTFQDAAFSMADLCHFLGICPRPLMKMAETYGESAFRAESPTDALASWRNHAAAFAFGLPPFPSC